MRNNTAKALTPQHINHTQRTAPSTGARENFGELGLGVTQHIIFHALVHMIKNLEFEFAVMF